MLMPAVDAEKCVGCESCASACPGSVFEMVDGKATVGENECLECRTCEMICPNEAIVLNEF